MDLLSWQVVLPRSLILSATRWHCTFMPMAEVRINAQLLHWRLNSITNKLLVLPAQILVKGTGDDIQTPYSSRFCDECSF